MAISCEEIINLLHQPAFGTLATQSAAMPGYPFVTVLPFVLDQHHCPFFLMSGLAEHTKNLLTNPKASLLVFNPDNDNVQTGSRLTVVGEVGRFEPPAEQVRRYLRYHPDAERYLALRDFAFFRLEPMRLRMIAGFGQMGWQEGRVLREAEALSLSGEEQLIRALGSDREGSVKLLGIDRYGIDVMVTESRKREKFQHAPIELAHVPDAARELIASLG